MSSNSEEEEAIISELKRYNERTDQLGHVADYDEFISALTEVWTNCYRALVPGGRLIVCAPK